MPSDAKGATRGLANAAATASRSASSDTNERSEPWGTSWSSTGPAGITGARRTGALSAASASARVMRPPGPLGRTDDAGTPASSSRRRTIGEAVWPLLDLPDPFSCSAPAGSSETAGAGVGVGTSTDASAAGTAGTSTTGPAVGAGASASPPIVATAAPTATVSPSAARIDVRTPAAGEGTSESTLSVEISKSGSSRATESPTALNQRVTMPSVTDSPSAGSRTSANVKPPTGERQHGLTKGFTE
jgi:hypothetical protein